MEAAARVASSPIALPRRLVDVTRPGRASRRRPSWAVTLVSVTSPAIADVSDWEVRFPEPGGSDADVWLVDPASHDDALFKPVVTKAGRRQGEDWAEKVVEQVAALVGVPSAHIRMATRNGRPGLLSYSLAPDGHELQTGAVLISEVDDRLVPRARERLGHNLANIRRVLRPLRAIAMPKGFTAFDQFCGYLVLDALVANRDRHEENWGVLRDPAGRVTLAPSYDHGNSLGFNLQDDRRLLVLGRDPDLVTWAGRGFADRFEASRDVTLVEFAHRALAMASPGTGAHWFGRLGQMTTADLERRSQGPRKCQRPLVRSAYDC